MKIIAIALALSLVSGCADMIADAARNEVVGQPPAYQDGYADGCNSGNSAAGHPYTQFVKDVRRATPNSLYGQGWQDGFAVCKARYDAIRH